MKTNKFLPILALLAGCSHIADTTLTSVVIAQGGVELNPIGFPGVVVMKAVAEGVAESYRVSGDKFGCVKVATTARYGSWIGTGATLGGLVAGPAGLAAGALIAAATSYQPSADSAISTCYRINSTVVIYTQTGWENK